MSGTAEPANAVTRRDFVATAATATSLAGLGGLEGAALAAPGQARGRDELFDDDWRFFRGDVAGAERPGFDDAAWRSLSLPHDWSLEDLPGAPRSSEPWTAPAALWSETPRRAANLVKGEFIVEPQVPPPSPGGPPMRVGPFDPAASGGEWSTGWTVGGVGWYRKRFTLRPAADEIVEIRFDGSYLVTELWLNGAPLGTHDHGHSGFAFDLTPHLSRDGRNVLAVRVRNEGFTSRWYNGSGLYRHVWLTRTGRVRVPLWGVYVSAADAPAARATVRTRVEVENRADADETVGVELVLRDSGGRAVGGTRGTLAVAAGRTLPVTLETAVESPRLWSPGDPAMHVAEVTLTTRGGRSDRIETPFGIRAIACDAARGLRINGEPIKLRGASVHADNGLLGAMAFDAAEERKVALLKANGFNAVRAAHNLFSPAFLDACDRLGMIVIEETFDVWNEGKFGRDLGAKRFKAKWRDDVAAMVRRDRNRPSIVFWQIGNEIPERDKPLGVETAARVRAAIRELDDTRLLTAGLTIPSQGARGEPSRRGLDVVGYNYLTKHFEPDHAANPDLVFMATEDYARDYYDSWALVEQHPWMIGSFCWTAIDFLGEVGVGASQLRRVGERPPRSVLPFSLYFWDYPFFVAGCGELDILGHKRPPSCYRDVLWGHSALELFVQRPVPAGYVEEVTDWGWRDELPSWTWPEAGRAMTVRAYSRGDEVRLLLDGREVARKAIAPADRLTAEFSVPYRPGDLTAVAYRDGREIARKTLSTVGAPARIRLRPERATVATGVGALAYVTAEVCDVRGRPVPDVRARLTFEAEGAARIAAAGSANPRGIESLRDGACTTFHGRAQVILAPSGRRGSATIRVSAPGLSSDRTTIRFT